MIEVSVIIDSSLQKVWESWTQEQHIVHWNFASTDWCCPKAASDFNEGGNFSYTMAAKDGSVQFEFSGKFDRIIINERIDVTLGDNRKLRVLFAQQDAGVMVTEYFEPENENDEALQKAGWQAILNNFKSYVEL